jgi:penicillin-binding protein 1A
MRPGIGPATIARAMPMTPDDDAATTPGTRLDDLRRGSVAPERAPGRGPMPTAQRRSTLRKWFKRLLVGSLVALLLGVAAAGGLVFHYSRGLPRFGSIEDYKPRQSSKVLGLDGSLVGELFDETRDVEDDPRNAGGRRTVVPYHDIPAIMVQALISAEDASFFEHSGFDVVGIAKALVSNLRPGSHKRGASTLTQQTVKTLLLSNERTLGRKIKELILSIRLEQNLTKEQILYIYLNQIYFGNRRYGIEEASRYYFGHGTKELTLTEACVLASLPKSPIQMNPRRYMKRATQRRNYVLGRMAENGYITREVADRESAKPIELSPPPPSLGSSFYVQEVRRQLVESLGEELVTGGGLTIETMMDPELQAAAEKAVTIGLRELDKRQGWRGAAGRIEDAAWEALRKEAFTRHAADGENGREGWTADALLDLRRVDAGALAGDPALAPKQAGAVSWRKREADAEIVARVEKVQKGSATIDVGTSTETIPLSSAAWAREFNPAAFTPAPKSMAEVVKPGELVLVRAKAAKSGKLEFALEQHALAEAALVSIDSKTRGVLALVGGYDARRSFFNRATQAKRQAGSSFKPFVYAAALETGRFTPRTRMDDSPELIRDRWTGKPWTPLNYEKDVFAGPLTLRKALAESKNTIAVKLITAIGKEPNVPMSDDDAQDRGMARILDVARRAGIDTRLPTSLTAALGSGEIVPMELVNAYATLAMQGRYAAPVLVRRVKGPDGETLVDNTPRYEQQPPKLPGQPAAEPVGRGLRADVAYLAGELMRGVVEDPDGTARSLQKLGRPILGKTGTTSDHRDAWFVGFTPEAVTGVWVGFDDHTVLGTRETGAHAAGPIWLQYMQAATAKLPNGVFEIPAGVVQVNIDPRTDLLADEHSPYLEAEVYLAGTEPTELSPPQGEAKAEDFFRAEGP